MLGRTDSNTGKSRLQLQPHTHTCNLSTETGKENVETQAAGLHIMVSLAHKHTFLVQQL